MPVLLRLGNLWGKDDPTPGEAFDVLVNNRVVASARLDKEQAHEMRAFLGSINRAKERCALDRVRFGKLEKGRVWHMFRFGFSHDREGTIPEFEDRYRVCFVSLCNRHSMELRGGRGKWAPPDSAQAPGKLCQECARRVAAINGKLPALDPGVHPFRLIPAESIC